MAASVASSSISNDCKKVGKIKLLSYLLHRFQLSNFKFFLFYPIQNKSDQKFLYECEIWTSWNIYLRHNLKWGPKNTRSGIPAPWIPWTRDFQVQDLTIQDSRTWNPEPIREWFYFNYCKNLDLLFERKSQKTFLKILKVKHFLTLSHVSIRTYVLSRTYSAFKLTYSN